MIRLAFLTTAIQSTAKCLLCVDTLLDHEKVNISKILLLLAKLNNGLRLWREEGKKTYPLLLSCSKAKSSLARTRIPYMLASVTGAHKYHSLTKGAPDMAIVSIRFLLYIYPHVPSAPHILHINC